MNYWSTVEGIWDTGFWRETGLQIKDFSEYIHLDDSEDGLLSVFGVAISHEKNADKINDEVTLLGNKTNPDRWRNWSFGFPKHTVLVIREETI